MRLEVGLLPGRDVKPFVHDHRLPLSSSPHIQWQICGGQGGQMAMTIQMQFASAVTELYEDAFVGSSMENGTTFNLSWGRRQCSVGGRNPTTSMSMNCRHSTIRLCTDSSSRRVPTWMASTNGYTSHQRSRASRPPSI